MDYILEMKNIMKQFPRVLANNNISINLEHGQVHALLGENGAGKSTLMNILSGLYRPDSGEIYIEGEKVHFGCSRDAIKKGIGMVYQHFELIPQLSVVENIILGIKQKREPFLDIKGSAEKINEYSRKYSIKIDPYAKVWQLSTGQQQWVEIIKALYRGAKILVLDEPTSVLIPQEIEDLFSMIRQFTKNGYSVIFISHKINEVKEISDIVTVLRNGEKIDTLSTREVSKEELADMMVRRKVSFHVEKGPAKPGNVALRLENVEALNNKGLKALKKVTLELRQGEILGIAGVDGNGQSELVETITGLRKVTAGKASLFNKNVTNKHPKDILEHNLAHIPENRRVRGLVLDMDLKENMILHDYYLPPHTEHSFLNWKFIREHTRSYIKEYDVRTPSEDVFAGKLSGGNQQKLILARELHTKPRILIAMHSTRGLD
ncbi:ABC transporter ATP-binding protein, partial [bacterium]|nr:ABC transporter ATP-binding protein [bacterium]